MSADSTSPNSSPDDLACWADRIQSIQLERATPDVRERMQRQAEDRERARHAVKSCSRIQRINHLSNASHYSTMTTYNEIQSSDRSSRPMTFEQSATEQLERGNTLRNLLRSTTMRQEECERPPMLRAQETVAAVANDNSDDDEEAEEDRALDQIQQQISHLSPQATTWFGSSSRPPLPPSGAAAGADDVAAANRSARRAERVVEDANAHLLNQEVNTLLQQLRVEPQDSEELEAKFKLFENFLATVEAARDSVLAFWQENKELFPAGTVRVATEKEVAQLDSHDSCAIPDDNRTWFVFYMLKKAQENSGKINQLLCSLRARLVLLTAELGECPICLDQLEQSRCSVLTCAHRVCSECWAHYSQLQTQARLPLHCPLCRHEEFLHGIMRSAAHLRSPLAGRNDDA